jgi:hypothetical protein
MHRSGPPSLLLLELLVREVDVFVVLGVNAAEVESEPLPSLLSTRVLILLAFFEGKDTGSALLDLNQINLRSMKALACSSWYC